MSLGKKDFYFIEARTRRRREGGTEGGEEGIVEEREAKTKSYKREKAGQTLGFTSIEE